MVPGFRAQTYNGQVRVLLISTYDMGRQPFGLASPAAWLLEAGLDVRCVDLAKEKVSDEVVRSVEVVGFFLPMHTATRLALSVIDRVRAINPGARLIAYGLYAPLNELLLRERGISDVLGGEFEQDLVHTVLRARTQPSTSEPHTSNAAAAPVHDIPRLQFRIPARGGLLPLTSYATLQVRDERRTAVLVAPTRVISQ